MRQPPKTYPRLKTTHRLTIGIFSCAMAWCFTPVTTDATGSGAETSAWIYPISDHPDESPPLGARRARIHRGFEKPEQQWLPGHRGVDFVVNHQAAVLAPADGTITFSASVFGRAAITITTATGHKNSFEPVQGILKKGDRVKAGEIIGYFAVEDGHHSHCFPQACIHWGVREANNNYLNPLHLLHDNAPSVLLPHLTR